MLVNNKMTAKVGDKVIFQIDMITYTDVITYIDDEVIEGEVFDLTEIHFKIIG
jgi:hypothetical protein